MKKLTLAVVMAVGLIASGCATINVTAPPGAQVSIATKGTRGPTGCTLYGEKRAMYLLYGLVPLGDNSTATIMPESGEVVVQTQYTFIDWGLSVLANLLFPTTLHFKSAKVYTCSK